MMVALMLRLLSIVIFALAGLFLYDAAAFCTRRDRWGVALSALTCVSCLLGGLLCAGVIGA